MRRVEQYLLLNAVDSRWKDHLKAVDALKAGIGLRGYGQVDPKSEYKKEGFELFHRLLEAVEEEVSSLILRIQVARPEAAAAAPAGQELPTPKGMGPGVAGAPVGGQRPARRPVRRAPASAAFDVQRRRQAMAAAAAGKGAEAPGGKSSATAAAGPESAAEFEGVGRNDACPCGSGKKFKKCHGKL
jgi:preprotein translocase subunit SecA